MQYWWIEWGDELTCYEVLQNLNEKSGSCWLKIYQSLAKSKCNCCSCLERRVMQFKIEGIKLSFWTDALETRVRKM